MYLYLATVRERERELAGAQSAFAGQRRRRRRRTKKKKARPQRDGGREDDGGDLEGNLGRTDGLESVSQSTQGVAEWHPFSVSSEYRRRGVKRVFFC